MPSNVIDVLKLQCQGKQVKQWRPTTDAYLFEGERYLFVATRL